MSLSRHRDIWLAAGLAIVIVTGVKIIAWQVRQGEQLSTKVRSNEGARTETKIGGLSERPKEPSKHQDGKTDDDISLDALASLAVHANYDIRNAATKILLHRYAANPYCKKSFSSDYMLRSNRGVDFTERVLRVRSLLWDYGLDLPVQRNTTLEGDERLEDWIGLVADGQPDLQGRLEALDGIGHLIDRQGFDNSVREPAPVRRPLSQWQRREAIVVDRDDNADPPELVVPQEDTSVDVAEDGDDSAPEA